MTFGKHIYFHQLHVLNGFILVNAWLILLLVFWVPPVFALKHSPSFPSRQWQVRMERVGWVGKFDSLLPPTIQHIEPWSRVEWSRVQTHNFMLFNGTNISSSVFAPLIFTASDVCVACVTVWALLWSSDVVSAGSTPETSISHIKKKK